MQFFCLFRLSDVHGNYFALSFSLPWCFYMIPAFRPAQFWAQRGDSRLSFTRAHIHGGTHAHAQTEGVIHCPRGFLFLHTVRRHTLSSAMQCLLQFSLRWRQPSAHCRTCGHPYSKSKSVTRPRMTHELPASLCLGTGWAQSGRGTSSFAADFTSVEDPVHHLP